MRARPRLFLSLGAILVLVMVSQTAVLAATWATSGAKVQKIKAIASNDPVVASGTVWVDIPAMSLTMSVPRGQAVFVVTVAGSYACSDANGGQANCYLRVLANGQELQPGLVGFGYGPTGIISGGTASMQFFSDPLTAGTYQFKAQWRRQFSTTNYSLTSRTMTVLRAKV